MKKAISFLQSLGASEVQVQYKETGWWLGRYDKQTKRFEKKPGVSDVSQSV